MVDMAGQDLGNCHSRPFLLVSCASRQHSSKELTVSQDVVEELEVLVAGAGAVQSMQDEELLARALQALRDGQEEGMVGSKITDLP